MGDGGLGAMREGWMALPGVFVGLVSESYNRVIRCAEGNLWRLVICH